MTKTTPLQLSVQHTANNRKISNPDEITS